MRRLRQDLRYAVRGLFASRAFSAVAILTLALGIGANTAIFSLLDEALLQRLPVQRPQELRAIIVVAQTGASMSNVPSELFDQLRTAPPSFASLCASYRTEMNLNTGGDVERVLVNWVSDRYYETLGVPMALGRGITGTDRKEHVAVVSHRFWMSRFGGDPRALGSTIYLNGVATTLIGVTPPGFFGIDRGVSPEITIPLPDRTPFANLWIMGRLTPGATDRQAQAEVDVALSRALDVMRPRLSRYRERDRNFMLTLRAGLRPADKGLELALESYVAPLRVLIVLSSVILLIACVNIANLLLARALARTHEFGVRLALGASRARLIRQVLTESALLAACGTVGGIGLAYAVHGLLLRLVFEPLEHRAIAFTLNSHVLLFSLAAAAATTLVFGLVPALRGTRVDVCSSLKVAAPAGRGGRQAFAKALAAVQVAAALVLLLGAGLLLRSFRNVSSVDPGVPLDRMLTMRIGLSARETHSQRSPAIYSELVRRVEAVPGVDSAALGWDFALGSGSSSKSIWAEGQPPERSQGAGFNVVGPGFFKTVGIPVVAGREFSARDDAGARKVVIVNEALVQRYFSGVYPIGRHLGDQGAASIGKYEIVGVVKDSRTMFLRKDPGPVLYQPLLQDDWASNVVLHVRTRDNPWRLRDRVRREIRAIDPGLPVYDVTTLSERRSLALRQDRMLALLSACFGGLALLLTAIGIFGVIAYSVGRRTAEMGIRMALGATGTAVRGMVVRETVMVVGIGVAIGIPVALAAARAMTSMLFGIVPQDPATLAAAIAVLLAAGALAGYLPADRAARVDPMTALRAE